jgi:myosin heavy subunit
MGPKQRKSSRRLSISQTFHTLKRSSSIIKDLPQQIINHLNTKKILTKKVWIENGGSGNSSSESSSWKLYRVIKQENNNLYLQEEGDGNDETNDDLNKVDRDNVIMINLAYLDVYSFNDDQHQIPDMINLKYLNEPTIIYNIKQRYLNKLPYTYMGSILITANPFEWSETFSPIDFIGKSFDPNKPHPYAIAGELPIPLSLSVPFFS